MACVVACVMVLGYMLALVVGLHIASLLTQLTNCQSLACTAHKIIEYGSVRNVMARSARFLTGLTIIWIGFVRMLRECGGLVLCARGVRDSNTSACCWFVHCFI